ncbi:hypothetical protein J1P26_00430 [Neobacillus sp. MM2021_6]|uniref:hypothetical protein n=1 Tax=Bacillaceae TaxID=186817 RepID=UPI00140B12C7|nr:MULTISPECIES: hypothetical protein [Bacillaceae]MBO0958182.1 hypothetical protein [Neobacillus sp. MM2021_6]NHC18518.1 hypothetical protein [Bacillus sp. MM2020_4]
MKILFMILSLFIPSTFIAKAETAISSNIENIDLKLKEHEAAVTFLDLSIGEATLIQGPNSKNILINVGGKGTKAELASWLSLYNVKEISALFLTNDGQDLSYNTLNQLIAEYNIKEIMTTPELSKQLEENINRSLAITIVALEEGIKKEILPEMTAGVQFVGNEENEGMDLLLNFYQHNIFLMTSFSQRAEQTLLKKALKDVNVFKIPNNNKEVSFSDEFIAHLNPQISILFSPRRHEQQADILHELHGIWSEVYFTKKHGTVSIKFTKTNYEVITIPAKEE